MKAVVYHRFGSPDVLQIRDVEKPIPKDNEVLIRIHAASVNPLDWHFMRCTPYLGRVLFGIRKPRVPRLGVDVAGVVEAVGRKVTGFQSGDAVFGTCNGAFAEYACTKESTLIKKPGNVTFEQAASIPVAALTALQGLRDKGQVKPGQQVLINGASGGVGTFAVQIAKWLGAEVTGVCSTRNVELVRSLGADHVVDYTREDFTLGPRRYDVLFDVVGSRSWGDCKRVLKPKAKFVIAGGPKTNRWIGPLSHMLTVRLASLGANQNVGFFVAQFNKADMLILGELLATGKMKAVIDRQYPLSELPEAMRYLGTGHARAKVVVTMSADPRRPA